jgi:hypothetical protein
MAGITLLNWTPNKKSFIIARANDPFDRNVQFDATNGNIQATDNLCINFRSLMCTDLIKVFVVFFAIYVEVITRIK